MLEYPEAVVPVGVKIYETFNPGAVYKVGVFDPQGREIEVWTGEDPTPDNGEMGVSEIPIEVDFATQRVKIYLDSKNVSGWNEIDAVGLVDRAGQVHWAIEAEASTTYATNQAPTITAAIEGTVVDEAGRPVPGAHISGLWRSEGGKMLRPRASQPTRLDGLQPL